MPALRLFIALDTPPKIRPGVAETRDRLKQSYADVKWEPNEKLHCTVKFLGNTDERRVPEIISSIETICLAIKPFTVIYRGLGCFPSLRDPRVVWLGIDNPTGELRDLAKRIELAMAPLGFEPELRAFHPHVTLGRVKGRKNLSGLLTMLETVTFESQPVTLPSLEIVKSELKTSGSEYFIVRSILFSK